MRQHITAFLCAAGVAATLSVFAEDYYLGVDEWGQAVYGTLEQYQAKLTAKFQAVENIESAAAQTKAKIDALWESSQDLVTGLTTTKSDFETALSELNDTAAKWEAWIEEQKNNTSNVKKSDLKGYAKTTDLSNYAKKSDLGDYVKQNNYNYDKAQNTIAHNEINDRLTSLENRPIGGGGAGCGEDCKKSLTSLATFLGDSLTVAESGSTGSFVTVTANGTLFGSVLNKLPICYYGSAFEVGSSAPKQIFEDAELTIPAFGAADIWAGEGLEAAVPTGPTVKKQLNVKVKNPEDFAARTLAQMLDGDTTEQNADGVKYADLSGVAAVDGEGHLRKINIGAISLAVDGNTIVREKKEANQEDSPLVLKAKIANMVDGSTITTEGEGGAAKAKVKVDALCDNDTIGVNASNKLCVKKLGIKIIGTDGNSNWPKDDTDTPAQTITFASASDSNVKVTVTGDKTSATVTIGVYYK